LVDRCDEARRAGYRRRIGPILAAGLGLFAVAALADVPPVQSTAAWRFLRTANPRGGPDAISMSHTADAMRSDLDLAGLMLRCGEIGTDVIIVVISPFPPRAHPSVIIVADGKEWRFEARVLSAGAELLLPADAAHLVAGPWQSAHELAIKISSQDQSFGGVIPIDGLGPALVKLSANCPAG
jgi:hypothetical protein